MIDSILMAAGKKAVPNIPPLLGYNFSTGQSTSDPAITTYSGGGTITAPPVPLAGYGNVLRSQTNTLSLSPLSALQSLGVGDFTVEFWMYMGSMPSNYQGVLDVRFANSSAIYIGFGNSGYGYRLQFSLRPATGTLLFAPAFTSLAANRGKWIHYALVRKNLVCRVYIDGVQQALAAGTSTSYSVDKFDGNYSLVGPVTSATLFGSFQSAAHDIYMPEFAFLPYAKYEGSFTKPTSGPIYIP